MSSQNHAVAGRVAKNTGILYVRMAITVFISLYSTRLILNALGVADYGVFNVVAGAIAMLTFLNSAMAGATQRFMSYAEGSGDISKVKTIFNVSIVLHLIISVLVLVVLEIVGYFLFHGILKIPPQRLNAARIIYQFMIVSTLFTIISVPYDAIINAHENMLLVAILGIIEALFKLGIAIYIMYTSQDKLVAYGLLTAISSILLLIIHRIYCHRKYDECEIKLKKYYNKSVFKEMTGFAGWNFLGSASSIVSGYGQGIVMNMFFGPVVNAAQGITNQVSGQLGAFASMMLKALNPVIVKSEGANDRAGMLNASMMGSKFSSFLLMFFFIPVLIEMPYIFHLWLKNVPNYAIVFCRLYLIRNLLDQFYVTFGAAISAVGNIKRYQMVGAINAILPIIICYFLFNAGFEPYWLYIIYIAFSLLSFVIGAYFTKVYCGLSIKKYLSTVIYPVVSVFGIVFICAYFPEMMMPEGIQRLFICVGLTFISYSGAIWLIGLNKKEKDMIIALKKKLYQLKSKSNPLKISS